MCDVDTGKCECKTALIVGDQCNECAVGNFNFPNCEGTHHYEQSIWVSHSSILLPYFRLSMP